MHHKLPSKQCVSRGMYKIHQRNHKNVMKANADIYIASLWIRSRLIHYRLSSPTRGYRTTKGIMPKVSRTPVLFENDEENLSSLRQPNASEDVDMNTFVFYQKGQPWW